MAADRHTRRTRHHRTEQIADLVRHGNADAVGNTQLYRIALHDLIDQLQDPRNRNLALIRATES